jgi:hypothetical protein
LDQATPGHVCECRKFNPIHDCPNEITGNFHECCCPEGSDAEGLAKTHVLMCDGEIHEHWNSCGEEDIPGELWCLDCGFDEEDCNICCYNEPGIHCGRMSRNDVVCSHQCLGAVNFGGVYSCGGDPGGFGQEGGFCSHGCENGMPSCTGNKPKYSGEPCNSDCQECEEVVAAGARFSPPASGSCWFDNRCSSFEGIDDGIRMNMGGNEKLIKSPQEMCREIGGVWHSDKSCDEFVPKNIREAEEANLNYNLISSQTEERRRNALERGWGKLLEKHPTKTIDDIIGARKKYTPVFDESGKLIKTKVELVFDSGPTGGQSELSTPTTVTQTVTNYPIQFQLVNFVADDKRKTEFRDISSPKDTKSKISLAELKNEKELGKPGAEFSNAETIIVNGELTAAITNDGTIGEGLLISFVSGSNIKLTTNESNNIIKISLDDIYLDEIVDVSDNEPNFGDVLQWRVGEGGSTGEWTPVSPNVGVTGPTGPIGGSDKQILFNQLGAASGSDNLKYDYETNTLDINSKVDFGSGFTFSGTANIQGNSIVEAEIKDYSETVHTIGNVTGSSLLVNVNNGNIQTFTKYVSDGGIVSGSFFNAGTGSVTMTLIMTDAGTGDGFTFPSAIWAGGNVPSYSASGTDIITFNTIDGGTSWYGFVGGLGFTG